MHDFLKKIYRSIIKILPIRIVLNIENLRGYHRLLKKNRIEYFGEKIQWIKLNGNLEQYTNLVDKYKVREYVKEKIGEEYLIELLGVYNKTEEIDFDNLPTQFVLKLNTGSGYNVICKDKSKINETLTKKQLNKWLREDYYKIKKEPQYKNISKKILCEKFLSDNNGNLLDYKFYCFNGEVEFIEVDFDRFNNHTMNFYDKKWNLLKVNKGKYKNYEKKLQKPHKLNEMISIAEKLSKELPFARIDLYYIDNKIYFGEITLTPAGGLTPFSPIEKDFEYASKIELSKYQKNNVLLFASIDSHNTRIDGETIKNRILEEYLKNCNINLITIDTHNWKKNAIKIILETLKLYRKADKIIISASQTGASKLIKFLNLIKFDKDIYFFLIGGSLANHIKEGKQKVNDYKTLKNVFVESNILKKDLKELGLDNIEVIYNFRKVEEFKNLHEDNKKINFVFYGRIIKVKGIEKAIDLIKRLTDETYEVTLSIYGQCDDEYLEYLKNMMNGYSNIQYMGVINPDGKSEYEELSKYDIFILPTEHSGEGLPGALIDSYIAELAVLVSDWKYAKEYVEDGKNGYIFEYKNYDDMYEKAKLILNQKNLRSFKRESKRLSRKFIIDDVLKDFSKQIEHKE